MSLSSRIRRHLRGNVIGYIALFVALSGTALALPGKKTVKGNDIANAAVKKRALAGGSVTNPKLAAGAVSAVKIADGSVTQTKLGESAVATGKLADAAIVRQKIARGEVTGGKIDVAAVSSPKLAGGAVISSKVADGSLEAVDFGAGQISDGFVFTDTPDLVGSDGAAFPPTPHNYNAPRAGRLLLRATTTATVTCGVQPCSRKVALFVDGAPTPVPGSTTEVNGPTGETVTRDLTSTALVPLAAGAHTIQVRFEDTGGPVSGAFANNAITGVLLQQ